MPFPMPASFALPLLLPLAALALPAASADQVVSPAPGGEAFVMDSRTLRHLWLLRESGLRELLNQVESDGGRYEVAEDGGIRIVPAGDARARVKALGQSLGESTALAAEGSASTASAPAADPAPAIAPEAAPAVADAPVSGAAEAPVGFVMDSTNLQRLWGLRQAGLHGLLENIAATGGSYEILPDGAIHIVPNNADLERLGAAVQGAVREADEPAQAVSRGGVETTVDHRGPVEVGASAVESQAGPDQAPHAATDDRKSAPATADNRVESWLDALRITGDWLAAGDAGESLVSGIQRIGRLYVVTLLESQAPHPIRSQLIIRASDGRLVAFDRRRIVIW